MNIELPSVALKFDHIARTRKCSEWGRAGISTSAEARVALVERLVVCKTVSYA